jgi:hypothetical protein
MPEALLSSTVTKKYHVSQDKASVLHDMSLASACAVYNRIDAEDQISFRQM